MGRSAAGGPGAAPPAFYEFWAVGGVACENHNWAWESPQMRGLEGWNMVIESYRIYQMMPRKPWVACEDHNEISFFLIEQIGETGDEL